MMIESSIFVPATIHFCCHRLLRSRFDSPVVEAAVALGSRYVDAEAMATKLLDSNTERDEAKAVLREIRALMTAETAP